MRTTKLFDAIKEVASDMGISTFSGDKNQISQTALQPRSLWVLPPTVGEIVGVFDSEVLYKLEIYYIEFIEDSENQNVNQMVDVMCRFAAELAKHSVVEHCSVGEIVPVSVPLTRYGELSVKMNIEVKISNCEHLSI